MVKKPTKLKCGAFTYTIVFNEWDASDYGSTEEGDKKIYINTRFNEETQRETLLHEIQHVAYVDCPLFHNLPSEDKLEEELIRYTNPKIFQILRDNPAITRWLFGNK